MHLRLKRDVPRGLHVEDWVGVGDAAALAVTYIVFMAGSCLVVSRRIAAPPQRVWDVVSNIAGAADTIESVASVELLTGQTIGVGTRWNETRVVFGRQHTETLEVTAFDPPTCYVVEGDSCGAHFTSTIRCAPEDDGATMLTMTMASEPRTMIAKLLNPLARLATRSMRKMLDQDLDDIARASSGGTDSTD